MVNSQSVCPSLAPVIINTYRDPTSLFVGGETILLLEGTTQGDPLGLAIYAIGSQPLVKSLTGIAKQAWFADDSAAGSSLEKLSQWWEELSWIGPLYGYYPNSSKTKLLVKPTFQDKANEFFGNIGVQITTEGGKYLGGTIGTEIFQQAFVANKVDEWMKELEALIHIAQSQPHAAYAAFTHGIMAKWSYVLRVIRTQLFPCLTGQNPPNDSFRELLTLPPSLGGLSLINPIDSASQQYQASCQITSPLVNNIHHQSMAGYTDSDNAQQKAKANVKKRKLYMLQDKTTNLMTRLPPSLQRCVQLSQEKGASTWLTALPLEHHNFSLHKSEFKDAIALHYNLPLQRLPSMCKCGSIFNVEHALSCPTGGYPTIRHNEVRDLTASLLQQVCYDVAVEPHLQPLSGETMSLKSSNTDDAARLDVSARRVWGGRFERTFFDIRVFNPSAQSNRQPSLIRGCLRQPLYCFISTSDM